MCQALHNMRDMCISVTPTHVCMHRAKYTILQCALCNRCGVCTSCRLALPAGTQAWDLFKLSASVQARAHVCWRMCILHCTEHFLVGGPYKVGIVASCVEGLEGRRATAANIRAQPFPLTAGAWQFRMGSAYWITLSGNDLDISSVL